MRVVITAQAISEAKKAGATSIQLPPGAIITPQAADDARSYGIALQRESLQPQIAAAPQAAMPTRQPAQAPMSAQAPVQTPLYVQAPIQAPVYGQASVYGQTSALMRPQEGAPAQPATPSIFCSREAEAVRALVTMLREYTPPSPPPSAAQPGPFPAPPVSQSRADQAPSWNNNVPQSAFAQAPQGDPLMVLQEEISRQVAARLGGTANIAAVYALVQQVMAERLGTASAPLANNQPAMADSSAPRQNSGVNAAGGAVLVRASQGLPQGHNAAADAVMVSDVLSPDASGPGVGYMQFTDSSFAWTFASDEVLTVLEGNLSVAANGVQLEAGPGDALRLSAGSSFTLTARGRVTCVYSAWPK